MAKITAYRLQQATRIVRKALREADAESQDSWGFGGNEGFHKGWLVVVLVAAEAMQASLQSLKDLEE